MRLFRRVLMVPALVVFFAMQSSCSDDEGPSGVTRTTGSVAGKVTFLGTWPSTGDVQVSIYSNLSPPYVPMGPPDAFTDPIQSGLTEFDYNMTGLDKGSYTAIYVGWRDPANPSGARLIGVYWVHEDSVGIDANSGLPAEAPVGVTIADGALDHTGLDITADLDLAP